VKGRKFESRGVRPASSSMCLTQEALATRSVVMRVSQDGFDFSAAVELSQQHREEAPERSSVSAGPPTSTSGLPLAAELEAEPAVETVDSPRGPAGGCAGQDPPPRTSPTSEISGPCELHSM
jgi:hypothetical protein